MSIARTALRGVLLHDTSKAYNSYTLFGMAWSNTVWLLDMEGQVVHRWQLRYGLGMYGILLPNGNLFYAGITKSPEELGLPSMGFASGVGGELFEVDWDGNVIWSAEAPYQHHCFGFLNNGHIVYPTHNPKGILPDELAAGWNLHLD